MPEAKKPNILILWGDDIGWWNISYNSRGQMGYRTPNIDRIANEGVAFTDYYGQQSCTAGRAAFITGQNPIRTGLTKVGMPGADVGLSAEDPTIAELLKPLGYKTGQFGKNHLGDKDQYLPTMHGFDEFFGNLYHLNAEEEPEDPDYPKDPEFLKHFGPRGVMHCKADGKGGQTVVDTGPLNKKRMETIDDEVTERALKFIDEAHAANEPFFLWYNTTGMHFRTHPAAKHKGKSNGQGDYNDVMVAHDEHIGQMLAKLDELGIADDTLVMYSTDNGPHYNSWPDAGITPFRSEKNTNWEGGWRVPAFVRWPSKFKAGTVLNGIVSHQDWLPTLLAAAGETDIKAKLHEGATIGDKTFKVHIDGIDMLAVPERRSEGEPEELLLLHQRRRRHPQHPDEGLEGRADGAAGQAIDVLVRAVREAQGAEDLQSAPRSVRAGGRELQHLLGLVALPRLHPLRDAGAGGGSDQGVRSLSAAPEAGVVQPRRGAETDTGGAQQRRALSRPWPEPLLPQPVERSAAFDVFCGRKELQSGLRLAVIGGPHRRRLTTRRRRSPRQPPRTQSALPLEASGARHLDFLRSTRRCIGAPRIPGFRGLD